MDYYFQIQKSIQHITDIDVDHFGNEFLIKQSGQVFYSHFNLDSTHFLPIKINQNDYHRIAAHPIKSKVFAIGGKSKKVEIYDPFESQIILKGLEEIESLEFSTNGNFLAVGSEKNLFLYCINLKKWIKCGPFPQGKVVHTFFSYDQRYVCSITQNHKLNIYKIDHSVQQLKPISTHIIAREFEFDHIVKFKAYFNPKINLIAAPGNIYLKQISEKNFPKSSLNLQICHSKSAIMMNCFWINSQILITSGLDHVLKIWNYSKNQNLITIKNSKLQKFKNIPNSFIAIDTDGNLNSFTKPEYFKFSRKQIQEQQPQDVRAISIEQKNIIQMQGQVKSMIKQSMNIQQESRTFSNNQKYQSKSENDSHKLEFSLPASAPIKTQFKSSLNNKKLKSNFLISSQIQLQDAVKFKQQMQIQNLIDPKVVNIEKTTIQRLYYNEIGTIFRKTIEKQKPILQLQYNKFLKTQIPPIKKLIQDINYIYFDIQQDSVVYANDNQFGFINQKDAKWQCKMENIVGITLGSEWIAVINKQQLKLFNFKRTYLNSISFKSNYVKMKGYEDLLVIVYQNQIKNNSLNMAIYRINDESINISRIQQKMPINNVKKLGISYEGLIYVQNQNKQIYVYLYLKKEWQKLECQEQSESYFELIGIKNYYLISYKDMKLMQQNSNVLQLKTQGSSTFKNLSYEDTKDKKIITLQKILLKRIILYHEKFRTQFWLNLKNDRKNQSIYYKLSVSIFTNQELPKRQLSVNSRFAFLVVALLKSGKKVEAVEITKKYIQLPVIVTRLISQFYKLDSKQLARSLEIFFNEKRNNESMERNNISKQKLMDSQKNQFQKKTLKFHKDNSKFLRLFDRLYFICNRYNKQLKIYRKQVTFEKLKRVQKNLFKPYEKKIENNSFSFNNINNNNNNSINRFNTKNPKDSFNDLKFGNNPSQNSNIIVNKEKKLKYNFKQNKLFLGEFVIHHAQFNKFHNQIKLKIKKSIVHAKDKYQILERKRQAEKEERQIAIRLKILKQNDMEGYMKMIKQTKNTKIRKVLEQTNEFLKQLGVRVLVQKGKIPNQTKDIQFTQNQGDLQNQFVNANKIYYSLTQTIKQQIKKQPNLLVGGKLKSYQISGLEWLVSLYNNNLNGILADEMGLGKTVQVIAMIAHLIQSKKDYGPFLIVVPLSTISNWEQEFQRWTPQIKTVSVKGKLEYRKKIFNQMRTMKWNVCLTTYEIAMIERVKLKVIEWTYLVIDEGHKVKNIKSKFSIIMGTEYLSNHRLLLTGTPLQNNLSQLWALLNFLLPRVFNSCQDFEKWFSIPILSKGNEKQKLQLTEQEQLLIINRLHQVLRLFLLRRIKKQVESQLPQKKQKIIKVQLSSLQKIIYNNFGKRNVMADRKATMNLMMQLRKVCNHPFLLLTKYQDLLNRQQIYTTSGKMELLDRIIPKLLRFKHRILLFSQMTTTIDLIQAFFIYRDIRYLRLDGTIKSQVRNQRMKLFNQAQSKYDIFLMSTRAGGLGLNLQTADTVILFDSDWNPQIDIQAQDRAHRIGQKNQVLVLRLITNTWIEQDILTKAAYKKGLDRMFIQGGLYNQKSSQAQRINILQNMLKENFFEYEQSDEIPDDNAINKLISRDEKQLDTFTLMDEARYRKELKSKRNVRNYRLIAQQEIPQQFIQRINDICQENQIDQDYIRYKKIVKKQMKEDQLILQQDIEENFIQQQQEKNQQEQAYLSEQEQIYLEEQFNNAQQTSEKKLLQEFQQKENQIQILNEINLQSKKQEQQKVSNIAQHELIVPDEKQKSICIFKSQLQYSLENRVLQTVSKVSQKIQIQPEPSLIEQNIQNKQKVLRDLLKNEKQKDFDQQSQKKNLQENQTKKKYILFTPDHSSESENQGKGKVFDKFNSNPNSQIIVQEQHNDQINQNEVIQSNQQKKINENNIEKIGNLNNISKSKQNIQVEQNIFKDRMKTIYIKPSIKLDQQIIQTKKLKLYTDKYQPDLTNYRQKFDKKNFKPIQQIYNNTQQELQTLKKIIKQVKKQNFNEGSKEKSKKANKKQQVTKKQQSKKHKLSFKPIQQQEEQYQQSGNSQNESFRKKYQTQIVKKKLEKKEKEQKQSDRNLIHVSKKFNIQQKNTIQIPRKQQQQINSKNLKNLRFQQKQNSQNLQDIVLTKKIKFNLPSEYNANQQIQTTNLNNQSINGEYQPTYEVFFETQYKQCNFQPQSFSFVESQIEIKDNEQQQSINTHNDKHQQINPNITLNEIKQKQLQPNHIEQQSKYQILPQNIQNDIQNNIQNINQKNQNPSNKNLMIQNYQNRSNQSGSSIMKAKNEQSESIRSSEIGSSIFHNIQVNSTNKEKSIKLYQQQTIKSKNSQKRKKNRNKVYKSNLSQQQQLSQFSESEQISQNSKNSQKQKNKLKKKIQRKKIIIKSKKIKKQMYKKGRTQKRKSKKFKRKQDKKKFLEEQSNHSSFINDEEVEESSEISWDGGFQTQSITIEELEQLSANRKQRKKIKEKKENVIEKYKQTRKRKFKNPKSLQKKKIQQYEKVKTEKQQKQFRQFHQNEQKDKQDESYEPIQPISSKLSEDQSLKVRSITNKQIKKKKKKSSKYEQDSFIEDQDIESQDQSYRLQVLESQKQKSKKQLIKKSSSKKSIMSDSQSEQEQIRQKIHLSKRSRSKDKNFSKKSERSRKYNRIDQKNSGSQNQGIRKGIRKKLETDRGIKKFIKLNRKIKKNNKNNERIKNNLKQKQEKEIKQKSIRQQIINKINQNKSSGIKIFFAKKGSKKSQENSQKGEQSRQQQILQKNIQFYKKLMLKYEAQLQQVRNKPKDLDNQNSYNQKNQQKQINNINSQQIQINNKKFIQNYQLSPLVPYLHQTETKYLQIKINQPILGQKMAQTKKLLKQRVESMEQDKLINANQRQQIRKQSNNKNNQRTIKENPNNIIQENKNKEQKYDHQNKKRKKNQFYFYKLFQERLNYQKQTLNKQKLERSNRYFNRFNNQPIQFTINRMYKNNQERRRAYNLTSASFRSTYLNQYRINRSDSKELRKKKKKVLTLQNIIDKDDSEIEKQNNQKNIENMKADEKENNGNLQFMSKQSMNKQELRIGQQIIQEHSNEKQTERMQLKKQNKQVEQIMPEKMKQVDIQEYKGQMIDNQYQTEKINKIQRNKLKIKRVRRNRIFKQNKIIRYLKRLLKIQARAIFKNNKIRKYKQKNIIKKLNIASQVIKLTIFNQKNPNEMTQQHNQTSKNDSINQKKQQVKHGFMDIKDIQSFFSSPKYLQLMSKTLENLKKNQLTSNILVQQQQKNLNNNINHQTYIKIEQQSRRQIQKTKQNIQINQKQNPINNLDKKLINNQSRTKLTQGIQIKPEIKLQRQVNETLIKQEFCDQKIIQKLNHVQDDNKQYKDISKKIIKSKQISLVIHKPSENVRKVKQHNQNQTNFIINQKNNLLLNENSGDLHLNQQIKLPNKVSNDKVKRKYSLRQRNKILQLGQQQHIKRQTPEHNIKKQDDIEQIVVKRSVKLPRVSGLQLFK